MNYFSRFFSSSEDKATEPEPERASSPAPAPTPIPTEGQVNVSDYPMPAHPVAQQHFDAVRDTVVEEYADHPNVLTLSNGMGDERVKYSAEHPDASDKDVIHHMQKEDAKMQFVAGCDGTLDEEEATIVPATSTPPFYDSLLDPDKRPETLSQLGDAAIAVGVGLAGQCLNGKKDPGNPFSG